MIILPLASLSITVVVSYQDKLGKRRRFHRRIIAKKTSLAKWLSRQWNPEPSVNCVPTALPVGDGSSASVLIFQVTADAELKAVF